MKYRLDLKFRCDSVVALFLKSIVKYGQHLERLVLYDSSQSFYCVPSRPDPYGLEDFLTVQFAPKMRRLVCCCILFYHLMMDASVSERINRLISEKVVRNRPSLWFHVDALQHGFQSPNVPAIHYHEMLDCKHYFPFPSL